MEWQTIGAFLVATAIIIATPGPVMAIVIGNTLNGGQGTGFRTVLGIGLGEVTLIGLLAISFLLSSRLFGDVFPWFSLASAAYLTWLAANTILRAADAPAGDMRRLSSRPFFDGLAVTVSNPTALLFYSAFFMPFVHDSQSLAAQLGVLAALYVLLSLTFDLACVIFIARFAQRRFRCPRFARIARLCSAAVYLGTSALAISSFLQAFAP
ncbi:MAG: LysE family translocator [Parvibaculaceae bacterium]